MVNQAVIMTTPGSDLQLYWGGAMNGNDAIGKADTDGP